MSAYADTQPDLCGGAVETFKIQCAKDSIDEIVDVFGCDFSIAPEQKDNYDDETIILSVKATRESMKSWAFTHAESMVVISPENFRHELGQSLFNAKRLYDCTGDPIEERIFRSDWVKAVKFANTGLVNKFNYQGKGRFNLNQNPITRIPELIDINQIMTFQNFEEIRLADCDTIDAVFTDKCSKLQSLQLRNTKIAVENLLYLTELIKLHISFCDNTFIPYLCKLNKLKELKLKECSFDNISFINDMPHLNYLRIENCEAVTDFSPILSANQLERLFIATHSADVDFSFLESMHQLKHLDIDSPYYSAEQAKHLQLLLPNCIISTRVYSTKANKRKQSIQNP